MMDTQLALHILQELHSIRSGATLLISGGEPTLHPDFKLIVNAGLERFDRVVVNSNGLRLAPLIEACSHPSAAVQISIDGDELTHDNMRGSGTFIKTIANINKLANQGIPVTIATTVTQNNVDSIPRLDRILANTNFSCWNVKRVVGSGRASDDDDITTPEWNRLVSELRPSAQNANRLRTSFMFSEGSIRAAASRESVFGSPDMVNANCGTGRSKLYVNPDGTVYPCACMEDQIIGSFAKQPTDEIIHALESIDIEPASNAVCRLCPAWKFCRGGCPGAAKRTIAPALGDPRCPLAAAGRRDAGVSDASR